MVIPFKQKIPSGSISNIVSEKSYYQTPSEELIAIVMTDGAKKINAEFDFVNDNGIINEPEYEIKVDANNKIKLNLIKNLVIVLQQGFLTRIEF